MTRLIKLLFSVALVLLLAATSCGKGKDSLNSTVTGIAARNSGDKESFTHQAQTLDDALSEMDALEAPLQADPVTWRAMKAKLAGLLTANLATGSRR